MGVGVSKIHRQLLAPKARTLRFLKREGNSHAQGELTEGSRLRGGTMGHLQLLHASAPQTRTPQQQWLALEHPHSSDTSLPCRRAAAVLAGMHQVHPKNCPHPQETKLTCPTRCCHAARRPA